MFIGSSTERYEIAVAIKDNLANHHACQSVLWWSGTVFEPSDTAIESLAEATREFDYAVFVVSGEDLTKSRGQEMPTPRDNIIFELGLFTGALGRKRTLIVYDEDDEPKLPTDLKGVTWIGYSLEREVDAEQATATVCQKLAQVFEERGLFYPCVRLQEDLSPKSLFSAALQNREFGLFWKDGWRVYPMTIGTILDTCVSREIACWSATMLSIHRLGRLLEKDQGLKNIDFCIVADSKETIPGLNWKPDIPDWELWESGKFPVPEHEGPFPPTGVLPDMIQAWSDMHNIAKELLQTTYMSPYRIVLSYFCNGHMTVTAGATSKATLIPYLHTPVVAAIDPEPGVYYGAAGYKPSSETRPHWATHHLFEDGPGAIIHCHPCRLMEWLESRTTDQAAQLLPEDGILEHQHFGTTELGNKLGATLRQKRSAILDKHGVWTWGQSFSEAYRKFLNMLTDVNSLTEQEPPCC